MTEEAQTVEPQVQSKEAPKKTKTKNILSLVEQIALSSVFSGKIAKHEDGTCSYLDKWDDAGVHAIFLSTAPDATIHNVVGARKKLFGQLRVDKPEEQRIIESLQHQVEGLQLKLEGANERIKELIDAHNDHQSRSASLIDNLQIRVRQLEFRANGSKPGDRQMVPEEAPLVDQKVGERLFGGCARVSNK